MSRARILWWALTLLTVVVYATLVWSGKQHLDTGDGQQPFDLRIMGYSAAQAQTYLDALHPVQVTLYAGPLRLLDTLFPILFGFWIFKCFRALGGTWRWGLWLGPAYALADLTENAFVARVLDFHGAQLPADVVFRASTATQVKFILLALALIALGRAGLKHWRGA